MKHLLLLLLTLLGLNAPSVMATEVSITPDALTLNAKLSVASGSITAGPMVLILHGTLAHYDMEIIATMQALLADEGINSLAPNLSLGIDNRRGIYGCDRNHVHKHENAMLELGYWVDWLQEQGVQQVLMTGHSRGGSQVTAYSRNAEPMVKGLFLIAPSVSNATRRADDYEKRYGVPLADKIAEARALVVGEWMPRSTGFIYCLHGGKVSADSFLSYYDPQDSLHTLELLEGQELPTVIVAGTADELVATLPAQMAASNLPKVQFVSLEDADHYFRDLYADELLELMLEQLQKVMQ